MEDYQRAVERLDAFALLHGHDVVVQSARPETVAERAAQIGDAEAIVLIRERTPIDAPLLALLPDLRLICQTGRGMPHIDVDGVHAPRNRRLHRLGVCLRARRAHARPDPRLDPLHRRRRRRASRRDVADDHRPGAARTHARDHRLREHRRARRRLRTGARNARARLGTRGLARARQRRRATRPSRSSTPSASARTSSACTSS